MFLSKRPNGVYYLFFEDETGKRFNRGKNASTRPEALEFLRRFNTEADAQRRALRNTSLNSFKEAFLSYSRIIHTPSTVESNDMALRVCIKHFGATRLLQTITSADCERFVALWSAKTSAHTGLRLHRTLGAAFERAKSWGHILDNPWRKVKKPKAPEVIPAYFTREQFRVLLSKIGNRDFRELVTVAALTGLRRGELLAMQWNWLDLSTRVLTVNNSEHFTTKSKRARVALLCDEDLTILLA